MTSIKEKTISGFFWRFLQNVGSQVIGFVVSMVLARLLMPSDYGLIAMITVFTNIANVFIITGFSSSIIQKKDISEIDKNTIFICGIVAALFLYSILFLSAHAISSFYHEPKLVILIRVQGIALIISALYSTHSALLTRMMLFRKSFISSLSGVCVQGAVGISLAFAGAGVWALIISYLINSIVCCIVTWWLIKWRPAFSFSWNSFKSMFSFSSKILCTSLVDTLFQNVQALIIGRQYSGTDLAYYNRGQQFPSLIMQQVDGSMNAVLFSSLAKFQDDREKGLHVLRQAMRASMYICFPLMVGLFAAAEPLIRFLLTDKWIDSVPFVRIMAILCLFWPLSASANALNALGKSGVTFTMRMCSSILTLLLILLTYKISVLIMVSSTLISSFFYQAFSAFVYRKYLNYKIIDQIRDFIPSMLIAIMMGIVIYSFNFLDLNSGLILLFQVIFGVLLYLSLSYIFKLKSYVYLYNMAQPHIRKYLRINKL